VEIVARSKEMLTIFGQGKENNNLKQKCNSSVSKKQ
jgi:hypothetical protein